MTNLKKQIRYSDWLVWISFGLMLLVKFATMTIFSLISVETATEINAVATTYEANPIFQLAFNFRKIGLLLGTMIIPALAMAYYYYMRRKVFKGKLDIDVMLLYVQFAFFALLINIVNDGAVLFGKIMQVMGG